MQSAVMEAPPGAIHGATLRHKLLAGIGKLRSLVEAARGGGRRGDRALGKADRALGAFAAFAEKGGSRGKIDKGLAGTLMTFAHGAKTALEQLRTGGR